MPSWRCCWGLAGLALLGGVEFPDNELEGIDWSIGWLLLVVLLAPLYRRAGVPQLVVGQACAFGRGRGVHRGIFRDRPCCRRRRIGHDRCGAGNRGGERDGSSRGPHSSVHRLVAHSTQRTVQLVRTVIPAVLLGPARCCSQAFTCSITKAHSSRCSLALVVPQFIAGTIFGYARVQYGFWAGVLLHVLHNGTALGLALLTADVVG